MFENSQEEIDLLKQSFELSDNLPGTIESLKRVHRHKSPLALYIATLDRMDVTWLFDKDEIYYMIGGEDTYNQILEQILPTELDKQSGIVFFIFKKIGPLYSVRLELDVIEDIIIYLLDKV